MPKNIIITGANGNLGTAVVKKFLDEKYKVIAIDHAANHLSFANGNDLFSWQAVDLANESQSESFIQKAIAEHKKIDGGLFLAGGFAMGDIKETNGEALKKMFSLNFETAYYMARPLFQHMLQNDYGRMVFVGARPALQPEAGKDMIAYALSKSLLFKLADMLNKTAKDRNVVASVIVPSTIDTPPNRQSMPDANPDNWVKAEQIADVLEFICSEKGLPLRDPVYKIYNKA
jgi:NAD(P)-dependent dehydrogenase (short-subunit alcohol dehydrogenase family)